MSSDLENIFPNIRDDGYTITSSHTPIYNCIAWAASDDTKWWDPDPLYQYYWPLRTRGDYRVESYIRAFESIGFIKCGNDSSVESGVEKVAIYAKYSLVQHMARQLPSGEWTSKCGNLEDITHHTLNGLESDDYGVVVMILKRQLSS